MNAKTELLRSHTLANSETTSIHATPRNGFTHNQLSTVYPARDLAVVVRAHGAADANQSCARRLRAGTCRETRRHTQLQRGLPRMP